MSQALFWWGSFPIGGSGAIVSTINEVLEAHGAQIMTNAKVAEIRIDKGEVLGVKILWQQVWVG